MSLWFKSLLGDCWFLKSSRNIETSLPEGPKNHRVIWRIRWIKSRYFETSYTLFSWTSWRDGEKIMLFQGSRYIEIRYIETRLYSHKMSLRALWWAGCETLLLRISAMAIDRDRKVMLEKIRNHAKKTALKMLHCARKTSNYARKCLFFKMFDSVWDDISRKAFMHCKPFLWLYLT